MKYKSITKLVLSILVVVIINNSAAAQKTPAQTRAEYLLYILKKVEWPNERSFKTFRIGLLGNEQLIYDEIKKQASNQKTPSGKSIEPVLFSSIDQIENVQMLYVNKDKGFDIGKIMLQIENKKILAVSEGYEFQKSMLNFIIVDNVLRFEINKKRIDNEGIYIQPLFEAKAIRSKADWEKLYLNTEKELIQEQIVVEKQKEKIAKQQEEIKQQEEKIQKQKKEIAIQQQRIEQQKQELNNLIINIKKQQKILQEKVELLAKQQEKIKTQQEEIAARKKVLEKQKESILEQQSAIKQQEEKINKQKEVLNDQLEKIEAQQLIMYLFAIIIVVIAGLGYFIYRSYKIKKRANILLEEKNQMIMERNEEILQQKEEIIAQRDEIESQRDNLAMKNEEILQQNEEIIAQRDEIERQRNIALTQRDEIAEQKREIMDSIVYARRIQSAILPPREYIGKNLRKYFILNKPRDVVSGDYYWITEKDNKIIVAAADCTGHGVPGAFMSMLGVALLNQIVSDDIDLKASEILNQLRSKVINSLRQTGKEGEAKDGMDIALCVIDSENRKIQYAGANNPLYLVRKLSDEVKQMAENDELPRHIYCNEKYELIEYKADKMPIGIYMLDKPFTNNIIQMKKNETIYIFSDGYADQFGGEKGKKFKYKPFKKMLLDIQDKDMTEQEKILDKVIVDWMGDFEQIDDVLVIGVRL